MNHLSSASSPYLLQHAGNPVEWYPWGEEAVERARREQKPIFLSIGYSTCHWCHVMAHESFENTEIAALMNKHFINVKIDREERPDVDRLYMAYVQGLTGSGGWPMSVWLTPDLKPFFGGTYFPPENRHGRAGFPSVLLQLNQLWEHSREKIEQEATRSLAALQASARSEAMALTDSKAPLARAAEYFQHIYDEEWGGFGSAPKFPRPSVLYFLLRQSMAGTPDCDSGLLRMVLGTLEHMAAGGIHDHLGGGFHRYSVDRKWHVPHFEKMLYDQAQLAMAYLEAWQITGEKSQSDVVHDILGYVEREMTAPEGGFYSAEDADSLLEHGSTDHAEGAFFVWTKEEIESVLGPVAAALFCNHYGVLPEGNVDPSSDPYRELSGKNVLMINEEHGIISESDRKSLEQSKKILMEVRSCRPRPHLDDKILCAWNGLMITAFARAGAVLDSVEYLNTAVKAAEFIKTQLTDPATGELRRSWRQGAVLERGFAEDYAFLIQGLLDLYEATFSIQWLQWGTQLQALMDRLFWDEEGGGYYSSAEGDPHLLVRLKEDYDGAEPSANSVASLNLLRLSRMIGDSAAVKKAERIFALSTRTLEGMPAAVPQLLVALRYSRSSGRQIVIAGNLKDSDTKALVRAARKGFHPDQVILLADGAVGQAWLGERIPSIDGMKPIDGKSALYRCENFTCAAPVTLSEVESFGIPQ
jgi:uncharacterized protein YyaL (SSP411 family)